jgi:AcrR family transcriptional regulator
LSADPNVAVRSSFKRLLATPTAEELWEFQKALLLLGGPDAAPARRVAHAFHSCLRTLESKSASRNASRWGAVLGTAAVASVSLPEVRDRQERSLGELLERALPAVLEIGAALRSAEAWEIEASLIYDEFAWFLYEELWDVSIGVRPELSVDERRRAVDEVLDPLLDPRLPDADRATLVVDVFRSVLAVRVLPLLG